MSGWRWPIPGAPITQSYYTDTDSGPHRAIDLAAPLGATVFSPASGTVVAWRQFTPNSGSPNRDTALAQVPTGRDDTGYEWISNTYGSWVMVDHGDEFSLHAHAAPLLGRGSAVQAGTPLAQIDQTGYTTGPHTHFERRSRAMERLDPMERLVEKPAPAPPEGVEKMRGRNAFVGRMGLWLRQYSDTGEKTLPNILQTMRNYGGYDLLVLKVADGMNWQSVNDPSMPLRSTQDMLAIRDQCEAAGVAFAPVVVPRGLAGEAGFHASIASAAGSLVTDIEPYPGFWDKAPYSTIPFYTRELRMLATGAYLVNQPDPREQPVRDARVVETAGHFDALCAQHYVGWSSIGWTDVNLEVRRFDQLATLGREMFATLYGVESINLAGDFWQRIQGQVLGGHCFAMGVMNADQLRYFGGLPRPPKPAPPVPPDPVEPPPVDGYDKHDLVIDLDLLAHGFEDDAARVTMHAKSLRDVIAKIQASESL